MMLIKNILHQLVRMKQESPMKYIVRPALYYKIIECILIIRIADIEGSYNLRRDIYPTEKLLSSDNEGLDLDSNVYPGL